MNRRQFTLAFVFLASSGSLASSGLPAAAMDLDGPSIDLETTLKNGLRVRRKSDFEYIHVIVLKVQNNELPLELVQSTFLWARKKYQFYPFPYFQRALKERAKRDGIDL